jgi:hypothetical protein
VKLSNALKSVLETAGVVLPAKKPLKTSAKRWELNKVVFEAACLDAELPEPEYEYKFHPERKWRFDILFDNCFLYDHPAPLDAVAVEIQGGLFTGGRHVRGAALLAEYEKLNEAQIMGYKVLLVTPKQVDDLEVINLVKRALGK